MRGIHRTGDFGYNGYNGDVCQTVGEIPKGMNGWLDDVTGWIKETVTDPMKKTAQAETEKAELQVTQQKLIMYASIAVAIFVAYSFFEKAEGIMKEDFVVVAVGILFAGAFYRYYKGYRPNGNGNPFVKTAAMGVRG